MNTIITTTYDSPVGTLLLGSIDNKLCLADWQYRKMRLAIDKRIQQYFNATYSIGNTPILLNTIEQLDLYFKNKIQQFDIPLALAGTAFQIKVWTALQQIPFGKKISYLQLSKLLGDEKAIRAVATANGANAISIIIPCHRIIGSNGELVGYAGGLPAKKKLLELEGNLMQTSLF